MRCLFLTDSPSSRLGIERRLFFWIPCSLRNLLLKFHIFSESDELVGNRFNRVAWWQPRFINSLHYFIRFSLVRARDLALFVLLDSLFSEESSSNVSNFLSTSLSSWEPVQLVLLGSSSFNVFWPPFLLLLGPLVSKALVGHLFRVWIQSWFELMWAHLWVEGIIG